jgi:hypothetical protein
LLSPWRRDTTPVFEHSRIKEWILPKKKKRIKEWKPVSTQKCKALKVAFAILHLLFPSLTPGSLKAARTSPESSLTQAINHTNRRWNM